MADEEENPWLEIVHTGWSVRFPEKRRGPRPPRQYHEVPVPSMEFARDAFDGLTRHQLEVFQFVCRAGVTMHQVAEQFGLEYKTIRQILSVVYRALGYRWTEPDGRRVAMDHSSKAPRACYLLGRYDAEQERE